MFTFLFILFVDNAHAFAPCESAFNCGAYRGTIHLNETSAWEETLTLSSEHENNLDLKFEDEDQTTSWTFIFTNTEQDFPRTFTLNANDIQIGSGQCEGADHCKYMRSENSNEINGAMTFDNKNGTLFRIEYKKDGSY